jgi:hypothetical protein
VSAASVSGVFPAIPTIFLDAESRRALANSLCATNLAIAPRLLPTFDDPLSAVPERQRGLLPGDDDLAMVGNGKADPPAPTRKTGGKRSAKVIPLANSA